MEHHSTRGTATAGLEQLRAVLGEKLILPTDDSFTAAHLGWNLAVQRQPTAIIFAESSQDVVAAVSYACQHRLPVAAIGTGHRDSGRAEGAVLINTSRMKTVVVNPQEQTAWVSAGAKWGDVLREAQKSGLAPLLGSSSDVGAVGYTLGGGMGWLVRKYSVSADSVLQFEIVTPDGVLRRASAEENSDLLWALRGGGGSFGVVTGMEIRLYPVTHVYAGNLYYPPELAPEIFRRFDQWMENAPDELTAAIVLMNFPPLPELPPMLSGKSFVIVRGCYNGPAEKGEALLATWRSWQPPLIDDFTTIPFTESDRISQDPVDPLPIIISGEWLGDLSDATADALARYTFPQGGPPLFAFTEVRAAGGAIARMDPNLNAYSHREEKYIWVTIAVSMNEEMAQQIQAHLAAMRQALGPALTGKVYVNFLDGEEMERRAQDAFRPETYRRLQAIKARVDPDCRMITGLNISPAA